MHEGLLLFDAGKAYLEQGGLFIPLRLFVHNNPSIRLGIDLLF